MKNTLDEVVDIVIQSTPGGVAVFVQLKNYPKYMVDSQGNVFRYKKVGRFKTPTWKPLKLYAPKGPHGGYPIVNFCVNGKVELKRVHQLVAEVFLGPRPEGMVINHKNGVRADNRPENLEYCTQKENCRHAWETGLVKKITGRKPTEAHRAAMSKARRGVPSPQRKFTDEQVLEILALKGKLSSRKAATLYEASHGVIQFIWRGKTYKDLQNSAD